MICEVETKGTYVLCYLEKPYLTQVNLIQPNTTLTNTNGSCSHVTRYYCYHYYSMCLRVRICACVPVGIPVYVCACTQRSEEGFRCPVHYPLPIHFEARSLPEPGTHGFLPRLGGKPLCYSNPKGLQKY